MRIVPILALGTLAAIVASTTGARAQTAIELRALNGLLPFGTLLSTPAGKAALAANYTVTGAIETGTAARPALQQPLDRQRAQALADAFITFGNAGQLADGLGTKLGDAYRASATYASADDGQTTTFTSISPNVETLIGYTAALSSADSGSAKFYFANGTVSAKTGAMPVSADAAAAMTAANATTDVYGKAYARPAGSDGADPFGDSRPFQTETNFIAFPGADYFGVATGNDGYLHGPAQNLTKSPSFPSGHTTYGYTESLLLATMVPERFSQMIARAAEYGNDRIVLGAHYAMDVIGGRTLATYDVAHLLAADPAYAGQTFGTFTIVDYRSTYAAAKADVASALRSGCGDAIVVCARADTGRFADAKKNEAFYESTQTYGLPVVYPATAATTEDVATVAPEAGYILTTAFPALTLARADRILTDTEGPGGGFLDNGSAFGLYSRLDLYEAGERARAETTTGR